MCYDVIVDKNKLLLYYDVMVDKKINFYYTMMWLIVDKKTSIYNDKHLVTN